jgi:hypothetical protein
MIFCGSRKILNHSQSKGDKHAKKPQKEQFTRGKGYENVPSAVVKCIERLLEAKFCSNTAMN